MSFEIGLFIAIAIVVLLFLLLKKKFKQPEEKILPTKKQDLQESKTALLKEKKDDVLVAPESDTALEDKTPETESEKETEEAPAPGVRLDESEEEEATKALKLARRERKLKKLRQGLSKTRGGFIDKIGSLFAEKKEIDPQILEELEEALITSDIGANTASWLIEMIKTALDKNELKNPQEIWSLLKHELKNALALKSPQWDIKADQPFTIMVVGVNGAGKTTTIGKLASQFSEQGYKIVLAAADTFRAAAVNQLEIWGRRTGSEVVTPKKEGTDPSSVVFDAIKRAQETGADIVIADTAGRLHTQAPLMDELKKIARVMGKAKENAPHQTVLVLDATTGQNALAQVKEFGEALDLTGLILTKLDGTAKGGVIVGICHEHKIPIQYIGIGETKDSLRPFEVDDFVEALFHKENS